MSFFSVIPRTITGADAVASTGYIDVPLNLSGLMKRQEPASRATSFHAQDMNKRRQRRNASLRPSGANYG